ncbi:MAG: aminomethyl-transferring glycine dehydrogenase, partial [Bdellovibrionales bacterium]|nr:aminomethyl-transferring glycine dehydrogenase [Bdellovibrionales bacterium]
PKKILTRKKMDLPPSWSEHQALEAISELAQKNTVAKSYIGLGYYPTRLPAVIQRNILENPGWYTQYTPYQAEISQGRLEALINFQTMVSDLTGMEFSNSSLLDEGTAAAEAMNMAFQLQGVAYGRSKEIRRKLLVDAQTFPQTIEVLKTRALPFEIELDIQDLSKAKVTEEHFAVFAQSPNASGEVIDLLKLTSETHAAGAKLIVATDLLSLALFKSPGDFGADIVIGSSQRFGVPMGFGGPHAAFLATKEEFKRVVPGRIIGVSKDADGNNAYRLALQTREQHIKRERATSNICTAQVLLAIMASMYAVYHGPDGLKKIASRIFKLTQLMRAGINRLGYEVANATSFDTITVKTDRAKEIFEKGQKLGLNFRYNDGAIGISLSEVTELSDVVEILSVFSQGTKVPDITEIALLADADIPENLKRESEFLTHPTFHRYRSETELLRYIHRLQKRDLSLTSSMIALGSCTMKLNAAAEMLPITWPRFSNIHPFAPVSQTQGYLEMICQLESWLAIVTGFHSSSVQPNAGSQGEYAGLLVIRKYQESKGQGHRNICLIPQSAHGTNPASAVMAGMKVVVVKCDELGNVDVADLKSKAEANKEGLSALMVTYPSTHGVFEESIVEICEIIHANGGQVYMDGANMNAQIGLCFPGEFGPDVCHLNLHKTFCIPHGGGGPGVGPICVREHLTPFLPGHNLVGLNTETGVGAVSSAPYGSPSILPIPWMYIGMMGPSGLKRASEIAILNANYIAKRLGNYFPVLYKGASGFVAHECIVDLRDWPKRANVGVEDVAKRLMDYGFHSPTMSFPVAGTLMIEPTESESLGELDRFCEAMISIFNEFKEIESDESLRGNNVLKNAPHTYKVVAGDSWDRPYSREKAAFPLPYVKESKFWPAVSRVDNAYGDKNLFCSCPPLEELAN